MASIIARIEFADDVWREVFEQEDGRQFVFDDAGLAVYDVWMIPQEDVQPTVVVDSGMGNF